MDLKLVNLTKETCEKIEGNLKPSYGLTLINPTLNVPNNFYTIKANYHTNFWKSYCELVKNTGNYLIGEYAESGAFVTEFNFRFSYDPSEEVKSPLNITFIEEIIDIITNIIIEELVVDEDKLYCFVLLSKEANIEGFDEKVLCYTMRVHFPFCNINMTYQKDKLRNLIIKKLNKKNVNRHLDQNPNSNWESIFNPNIPYLYLPMYGAKTKCNVPDIELKYIYKFDKIQSIMKETDMKSNYEDFNPNHHLHVEQGLLSSFKDYNNDNIKKFLPIILSLIFSTKHTIPKNKRSKSIDDLSISESLIFESTEPKDETEFIEIFLQMLSNKRCQIDFYIEDIGKAIYKAYNGNEDGLDRWIRYCIEKDGIYTDSICRNKYPSFRNSFITYKTLAWYASMDSPDKYNEWHVGWIESSLEKSLSESHNFIAEVFYRCNWLNYVYSNKRWFQYDQSNYNLTINTNNSNKSQKSHRWKLLADGQLTLGKELSGLFLRLYDDYFAKKSNLKASSSSNEERDKIEKQLKSIMKIKNMLTTNSQKKYIISECCEKFHLEDFENNLDTNTYLIGMDNCVVDLSCKLYNKLYSQSNKYIRMGKPEDYISMSTGQRYRYDFNWDSMEVKMYLTYLSQVFSDIPSSQEIKNIKCSSDENEHCGICEDCKWGYLGSTTKLMRKDIASMLKGRNAEKIFRVYSGAGDNSKSVFMKLMQKAFGSYCIDMPVSAVTQKRGGSSNASPEMARSKGSRIAIMSEPDDDEKIKAGLVKGLTGNDRFFARFLHDNGREIDANFKLILVCNKIPPIPNGGKAIKNRFRVVPFLSTFVDYPPESLEEQKRKRTFKKDPDFEENVDKLASAMIWSAINDFDKYVTEGLTESSIINEETNSYWNENDPYEMFKQEILSVDYEKRDQFFEKLNKLKAIKKSQKATPRGKTLIDIEEMDIKEEIDNCLKGEKSIGQSEIYRYFKSWYRDAFPGTVIPDSPQVKLELLHRLGPQTNRKWYFVSVKEELTRN
jgi:hypothetical protein